MISRGRLTLGAKSIFVSTAGLSIDKELSADTPVTLATFKTSGESSITLSGIELGEVALPDSGFTFTSADSGSEDTLVLDVLPDVTTQIIPYADYSYNAKAISIADALGVIKTLVGLESPNGKQLIASDINSDGKISIGDALGIIKYLVGMPNALEPEWVFVDRDFDYSGISSNNIDYSNVIDLGQVTSGLDINLEGILLGDFNGTL